MGRILQLGNTIFKVLRPSTGDIGIFGAGVDLRPKTLALQILHRHLAGGRELFCRSANRYRRLQTEELDAAGRQRSGRKKYLFAVNTLAGERRCPFRIATAHHHQTTGRRSDQRAG